MPILNRNSLGQPFSDNKVRRNRILHDVNTLYRTNTSLEKQVTTLRNINQDMGRELIRSNLRYAESTTKLNKINEEVEQLKSTICHFQLQLATSLEVTAQKEGHIGVIERANSQLEGQLDRLHQLNYQVTQQYGQASVMLGASITQQQKTLGRQLPGQLVDSETTITPHHLDNNSTNNSVKDATDATARPKVVGSDDHQQNVPTLAKDQVLTPTQYITASPSEIVHRNDYHDVSSRASTSSLEVKSQPVRSPQITATKSRKPATQGIVRGGKDVEESFQRFLRNQNPTSVALNVDDGAATTPKDNNVAHPKLNPESAPFTPSTSVTTPGGTLNPISGPFGLAGSTQPVGLTTSFPVLDSRGKKPLHSSESLVWSEAKDEPHKLTTSATQGYITEMASSPSKHSTTAVKASTVPSTDMTYVTHDAASTAMSTVEPTISINTKGNSKLPLHQRTLSSVGWNEVGETSDKRQPFNFSIVNEGFNVPRVPVKGEPSISALGIEAATKKWLSSFDDQTTLASDSHRGPSTKVNGEGLISVPNSPEAKRSKVVPVPPGYTPIAAPGDTTLPAPPMEPRNISKAHTDPKNQTDPISRYMELGEIHLAGFTAKYANKPVAGTRKELAEETKAPRIKLEAAEVSHEIDAPESSSKSPKLTTSSKSAPYKMTGTPILGQYLDEATKAEVLTRHNSAPTQPLALNWKPVKKNGETYYVL